jgi:DNA-binding beta-propeller fold protein YncE
MLAVFDRYGNFTRYIGNFKGENEYESPQGIAIDQKTNRLYLVDSPRNLVFVLDLRGKVLKRLGKYHDGTGVGQFDDPTDIAVNRNRVYVLDNSGTRVQIMDSECNFRGDFNLPRDRTPQTSRENGLGTDQGGNVYVGSFSSSVIRVYSQDGRPLAWFGQSGRRVGEFTRPNGLWIDSANRLYVADSGNGRVQLFQLQAQP